MADSLTTQCKRGMGNWSMSVLDKRIRTDDEASACDDDDGIYRWDAGLLYKTPRGVTVLLMNTAAKTIRKCATDIEFTGYGSGGFAILESKLYAFDCKGYARQQFSVYDLSRIPAKGNQPFELKPAGFLRSPKSSPLVIPYASGNKMFIIPTGPRDVEPHCRLFCEVLHLAVEGNSNYVSKPLETPFDYLYSSRNNVPYSQGFAVSGKYAYIHLRHREMILKDRLFCLDMDAELFEGCLSTELEEPCSVFAPQIDGLWENLGFICRNKLFVIRTTGRGSAVHVSVSSNLNNYSNIEEFMKQPRGRLHHFGLEPLVDLSEFITNLLKHKDYLRPAKVWTLPLEDPDEEGDKFSMFISYVTAHYDRHLLVCNFNLVDQPQIIDIDDVDAGKSRYKCKTLSHAFYGNCFPDLRGYANAFTPVSNMVFNKF